MSKAALTALALLCATGAYGQSASNCGPREKFTSALADRYGETRRSMGLRTSGQVMEVWASDDTGSWTITVTTPQGTTCLIAAGQFFENLSEQLIEGGAL